MDTQKGCCNGCYICDFGVVSLMISCISSGRIWLVKQCAVRLSTCGTLHRRGDLDDLEKYSVEYIQLKDFFFL